MIAVNLMPMPVSVSSATLVGSKLQVSLGQLGQNTGVFTLTVHRAGHRDHVGGSPAPAGPGLCD
jgi:hypothetical protein